MPETSHQHITEINASFPFLQSEQLTANPRLVYLDNAATAQTLAPTIAAMVHYYQHMNANVHRGVHRLSAEASLAYEAVRGKVQRWINAASESEIIFVRGTTEAINLVAHSYGLAHFQPGDEVIITMMEHHANIVPWQLLRERVGIVLRVIDVDENGVLNCDALTKALNERTKLVSIAHASNFLGTINPVQQVIDQAHAHGVPVLLDGAQAIVHGPIDVQQLDVDFYAFSGHKMYGPTGIGVLYAKEALQAVMSPYQGGGDMIREVSFEKTRYAEPPAKFEAGTPNIAGTLGLGAAIDAQLEWDWAAIAAHENTVLQYATDALSAEPDVRIIGQSPDKVPLISFVMQGVHPHDIATVLDEQGVAVRAGHHCAMPLTRRFSVPATVRASMAVYNTCSDIDALVEGLAQVRKLFL